MMKPIGILSAALLIFAGCVKEQAHDDCLERALHGGGGDRGLVLTACPVIGAGAAEAEEHVVMILRNDGEPRAIDNRPDYYRFTIVSEDGDTLRPTMDVHRVEALGSVTRMVLPRRSAVVMEFNLRCLRSAYSSEQGCDASYQLEPGRMYTLYASFFPASVETGGALAAETSPEAMPVVFRAPQ